MRREPSPARRNRSVGRFEQADGGTLFLDEIGDMPMEAQTRLLRVLQEGEYMTVGGRVPIKTDVRIIAATNKSLENQISLGLFREDLYYRLNVVPLRMPPLRERLEDVPDLVRHFLKLAEKSGLPSKTLTQDAFDRLKRHNWPGNVRELENLVRRLSALYSQELISADIVDNELSTSSNAVASETPPPGKAKLNEWMEAYLSDYFGAYGDQLPPPGLYDRVLRGRGNSADHGGACGDAGKPDQSRRASRSQQEYPSQEGARAENQGHSQSDLTRVLRFASIWVSAKLWSAIAGLAQGASVSVPRPLSHLPYRTSSLPIS